MDTGKSQRTFELLMRVTRTRFTNGFSSDEISGHYTDTEVVQRDNNNWPSHSFYLKHGKWEDWEPEPSVGYQRLIMYGADILLVSGGFIVTGFVYEDPPKEHFTNKPRLFTMERWHCYGRIS